MENKPGQNALIGRLIKAVKGVGYVKNEDKNRGLGYSYPSVTKMIAEVRNSLIDNGVFMQISTKEQTELTPAKTAKGSTMHRFQVTITVTLMCSDSDAALESDFSAISHDHSDKALSKAYTGALKQALKHLFLIQTGDDAEPDAETPEPTLPGKKLADMIAGLPKSLTSEIEKLIGAGKASSHMMNKQLKHFDGDPLLMTEWVEKHFGVVVGIDGPVSDEMPGLEAVK